MPRVAMIMLGATAMLLLACGGGDNPYDGASWSLQARAPKGFADRANFDKQGNFVSGDYSFDPKLNVWSSLVEGRPTVAHPTADLAGNLYGISDTGTESALNRLDGPTWTLLYPMPEHAGHFAFGPKGAIWAAVMVQDTLQVYRRGSSDWQKTYEGPATEGTLKNFYNDPLGNLYLTFSSETRMLTPTGDAVKKLFDCDGPQLWPYCSGAEILSVGASPEHELIFGAAAEYYRAASQTAKPMRFAVASPTFWIEDGHVFHGGDIFSSAKKVSGDTSSLLYLGWGQTEFKEVLEMPCFGCAFSVRDDGTVFAYDGMGSLWRLMH